MVMLEVSIASILIIITEINFPCKDFPEKNNTDGFYAKIEFCKDKDLDYNTKKCSYLETTIPLVNSLFILLSSLL